MTRSARFETCALFVLFAAACASSAQQPAETPPKADSPPGEVWARPDVIDGEVGRMIGQAQLLRKELAASEPAQALDKLNELLLTLDDRAGMMSLIANVHPDAAIRTSAEEAERKIEAFVNELSLDRAVYDALLGVDVSALDAGSERFLERTLRDFRLAGVDKDEATRAQLQKLHGQLVEAGQEFARNIRDGTRTVAVAPDKLAGLPGDFIEGHKKNAQGLVELTTNYPDYFPIQRYAEDEETRRHLAQEFLNRGHPENDAVLMRILKLRFQYAELLGFDSWADYKAQDKMAKSATTIKAFTEDVANLARPRMQRDLKEVLARKRKDNPKAKEVGVWDRFYYVQLVQKENYGYDASAARAYFQYDRVLQGLLDLYGELFGIQFERVDAPVWHPQVRVYDLVEGGEKAGRFYLDMHPRDGKYSHAAMFPVITGLSAGRTPEAALVCNFPDPSKGPALMEHSDVVTFFHEFGHLIHHLLARSSKWVALSGINTEWDFVEAPSQLLEEWAWDPRVLSRFAKHHETNEPIPADLVQKMRKADEFGKGMHVMRQVFYQAMSFYLHARSPDGIGDLVGFTKDMQKKYSPYPYLEGTHVYAGFGHLEGYSSMYYTYQWSLSLAKDIFTKFESSGLLDKETSRLYRETILEPGGTKAASDLVADFLGRPSNLDAYKRWLESS